MSIQSGNIKNIAYLPLSEIKRPIPPTFDYEKIEAMSATLQGTPTISATCPNLEDIRPGELPPIDVLGVRHNGKTLYFAFGGCHRFQAYEKNPQLQVRCKVLPCTKDQLRLYLGSSVDKFFD